MRGTLPMRTTDGKKRVLVYGSGGIWLTDSLGTLKADWNGGLPHGADNRQVRGVAAAHDGSLWAVTPRALYHADRPGALWQRIELPLMHGDRLSDITIARDTIVALGRSAIYAAASRSGRFEAIEVPAPDGYDRRISLFRSIWLAHSGQLYGQPGIIAADIIAGVLAALCISGIVIWLLPPHIKRRSRRRLHTAAYARSLRMASVFHGKLGAATFILTIAVCLTGWSLRPPVLIALVKTSTAPPPGSVADNDNAWHDKLRMIRYDAVSGEWLLSTSDGFHTMIALTGRPAKTSSQPPVSVMGLNVLRQTGGGDWLCGSFSGLFRWNRETGGITDMSTGLPAQAKDGPPFGAVAVAGYSDDFGGSPVVARHDKGTDAVKQPDELACIPMSLWNVALETHTGRIFFGNAATWFFIFIAGGIITWSLISGYMLHRSRRRARHRR